MNFPAGGGWGGGTGISEEYSLIPHEDHFWVWSSGMGSASSPLMCIQYFNYTGTSFAVPESTDFFK
jgi:hypothetical protein